MAARLTKPTLWCKASLAAAVLLPTLTVAAAPAPSPAEALRDCIARAGNAAAIAGCEMRQQLALKDTIETLAEGIRKRLDARGRLVFDRSAEAWQAFVEHESAMIELSLGQRKDGLGASLKPGAVTRLYEEREQQLREHLHNLSIGGPRPRPPG